MGLKAFDYNNDGHLDLFLTDMHSDMSYVMSLEEETEKANILYPESFLRSEGRSIYGNAFYQGDGNGGFAEVSNEIGAENFWPWGLSVGDLNADGFEDVFIASSMNYPFRYGVNSILLNNMGQEFLASEFILGVEPRRDDIHAVLWFQLECASGDRIAFVQQELTVVNQLCDAADQIAVVIQIENDR